MTKQFKLFGVVTLVVLQIMFHHVCAGHTDKLDAFFQCSFENDSSETITVFPLDGVNSGVGGPKILEKGLVLKIPRSKPTAFLVKRKDGTRFMTESECQANKPVKFSEALSAFEKRKDTLKYREVELEREEDEEESWERIKLETTECFVDFDAPGPVYVPSKAQKELKLPNGSHQQACTSYSSMALCDKWIDAQPMENPEQLERCVRTPAWLDDGSYSPSVLLCSNGDQTVTARSLLTKPPWEFGARSEAAVLTEIGEKLAEIKNEKSAYLREMIAELRKRHGVAPLGKNKREKSPISLFVNAFEHAMIHELGEVGEVTILRDRIIQEFVEHFVPDKSVPIEQMPEWWFQTAIWGFCGVLHTYTINKYPLWWASVKLDQKTACLNRDKTLIQPIKGVSFGSKILDALHETLQRYNRAPEVADQVKEVFKADFGNQMDKHSFLNGALELIGGATNHSMDLLLLFEYSMARPRSWTPWKMKRQYGEPVQYDRRARPWCFVLRKYLEATNSWDDSELTDPSKACFYEVAWDHGDKIAKYDAFKRSEEEIIKLTAMLYQLTNRLEACVRENPGPPADPPKRAPASRARARGPGHPSVVGRIHSKTERRTGIPFSSSKTERNKPERIQKCLDNMPQSEYGFDDMKSIKDRLDTFKERQSELSNDIMPSVRIHITREVIESCMNNMNLADTADGSQTPQAESLLDGAIRFDEMCTAMEELPSDFTNEFECGESWDRQERIRQIVRSDTMLGSRVKTNSKICVEFRGDVHLRPKLRAWLENRKKDEILLPEDNKRELDLYHKWTSHANMIQTWKPSRGEESWWARAVVPNQWLSPESDPTVLPLSRDIVTVSSLAATKSMDTRNEKKYTSVPVSGFLDVDVPKMSGKLETVKGDFPSLLLQVGYMNCSSSYASWYELDKVSDDVNTDTVDYLCVRASPIFKDFSPVADLYLCPGVTARDFFLMGPKESGFRSAFYRAMALETESISRVKELERFLEDFLENEERNDRQKRIVCYLTGRFIEEKYPLWWAHFKEESSGGRQYFCNDYLPPQDDRDKLDRHRISSTDNMPVMPAYAVYVPGGEGLFFDHTVAFENCKAGNTKPLLQLAANIRRWGLKYQASILDVEGSFAVTKLRAYKRVLNILMMIDKISPRAYAAMTDPQFLMEILEGSLTIDDQDDIVKRFIQLYSSRDSCFQALLAVVKACQSVLESTDSDIELEETVNEATRGFMDNVFEHMMSKLDSLPFLGTFLAAPLQITHNVAVVAREREFRSRIARVRSRLFMMFLDIDAVVEYKAAAVMQLSKSMVRRKRDVVCAVLDLFCTKSDAIQCDDAAGIFFRRIFKSPPRRGEIQCRYTRDRGTGLMADSGNVSKNGFGLRMRKWVKQQIPVLDVAVETLASFLEE